MLVASKHLKGQFGTPESQRGATVNANRKRLQKLCRPIVQFLDLSKPLEKSFAKRAQAEHRTDSTELIPKSTRPNNIVGAGIIHQKYDDEYTGFAMKS